MFFHATIHTKNTLHHRHRKKDKTGWSHIVVLPLGSCLQLAVTLFLALVVGAIFFDVKDDQSGVQNRLASSEHCGISENRIDSSFISPVWGSSTCCIIVILLYDSVSSIISVLLLLYCLFEPPCGCYMDCSQKKEKKRNILIATYIHIVFKCWGQHKLRVETRRLLCPQVRSALLHRGEPVFQLSVLGWALHHREETLHVGSAAFLLTCKSLCHSSENESCFVLWSAFDSEESSLRG